MNEREISRRAFLRKTADVALAAGAVGAVGGLYTAFTEGEPESIKKRMMEQDESLREQIEKEKTSLKAQIREGMNEAASMRVWKEDANNLLDRMRTLDETSEEYSLLAEHRDEIIKKFRAGTRYKLGSTSTAMLEEANPYAQKLLEDEAALEKLALLKIAARQNHFRFGYIHNYAPIYANLGQIDVAGKMDELPNTFDEETVKHLSQEDLFYFMQAQEFDPSLTAESLFQILTEQCPDWEATPAINSDTYFHNNELGVYSVFELNRIKDMARKLQNPSFIASIFTERDNDLADSWSESGGIIPIKADSIRYIAPSRKERNGKYIPSVEDDLFRLENLASFHFHATAIDSSKHMGPSNNDSESTFPEIVFTSLDQNKIAVHLYVSRKNSSKSIYDQMDVISLGTIER